LELKGAAKAPTVGLLRLNILRVTKTMFLPLKGAKSTPALLIWESPRDIYGLLAILTVQAWSIKDLLYGFWGNFFAGRSG